MSPQAGELDPLDGDDDEATGGLAPSGDDDLLDHPGTAEPGTGAGGSDGDEPPAVTTGSADPLRAERRRSNQLEKELRKARAQLARFSWQRAADDTLAVYRAVAREAGVR